MSTTATALSAALAAASGSAVLDSNFRQTGKSRDGTLSRGVPREDLGQTHAAAAAATTARVPPSIPSKFETTLHGRKAAESDAFGQRTTRFEARATDVPGPGLYYNQSTMVRNADTCGSVSQRGYSTGFASRTQVRVRRVLRHHTFFFLPCTTRSPTPPRRRSASPTSRSSWTRKRRGLGLTSR